MKHGEYSHYASRYKRREIVGRPRHPDPNRDLQYVSRHLVHALRERLTDKEKQQSNPGTER